MLGNDLVGFCRGVGRLVYWEVVVFGGVVLG